MNISENLSVSKRDLIEVEKQLIGEKRYDYYRQRFDLFEANNRRKWSLNLSALIASFFWAFYRGLYLAGFIGLLVTLGGFYLVISQQATEVTPIIVAGNILTFLPNLVFGVFGNRLYYDNIMPLLHEGLLLPRSKQASFFKEYSGGNTRIVVGLLFAVVFIIIALSLSAAG